jgi:predicted Zn-dependent protease
MSKPSSRLRDAIRRHPRIFLAALGGLVCLAVAAVIAVPHLRAEYHFRQASKAFAQRNLDKAASHLQVCLQTWPNGAGTHFLAAQVARRAGRYDDAEEHLRRAEELGYDAEFIKLEALMMQAQRGKMSPAVEQAFRACIRDDVEPELVLEALIQGLLRNWRSEEALDCLDDLLRRRPDDTWALLERGRLYQEKNRYEDALADFSRLLALDPQNQEAQLPLAQMLIRTGNPAEAVRILESLWDRQPDRLAVGIELVRARRHRGQMDRAERLLQELAAKFPTDAPVWVERGRQARQKGQLARAETSFRKAVALAPHDFDANYGLWQTLQAQGNVAEAHQYQAATRQLERDIIALKATGRALKQAPRNVDLCYRMGLLNLRLGHPQAGLGWLHRVLDLRPDHSPAHQALADWYAQHHQPDQAAYHRRLAQQGSPTP